MLDALSVLVGCLVKASMVMLAVNEIRGLILAGPILYGMYEAGGTWMAIWIGICSLGGIALSVVVPLVIARKLAITRHRLKIA
jgi:hypothetical protein